MRGLQLAPGVDLAAVAAACHGYSGADLAAAAREAAMAALAEVAEAVYGSGGAAGSEDGDAGAGAEVAAAAALPAALVVDERHLAAALGKVRPSIVRGAEVDVAPVRWGGQGRGTRWRWGRGLREKDELGANGLGRRRCK